MTGRRQAIGNESARGTGRRRGRNDIASGCAGGEGRREREFGAVDRAPNLKGLRGLAVRQDAVPLCRNADGTRERNKGRMK